MPEFIITSLIAGISVAVIAGPLGCFIIWKRMSYFGDSLAHAALLGVTLGLFLNIDITYGALIIAIVFALILSSYRNQARDTIIGILAHSGIALSLIILSFIRYLKVDINSLLFGNILSVSKNDIQIIIPLAVFSLFWLLFIWKRLLLITISEDIALSQKINVNFVNLQFMLIISLVTATAIKIVGALLITSLLIIPAASARNLSNTPIQMLFISAIIGIISILIGIALSYFIDLPAGPSIVVAGLLCFIISSVIRFIK